MKAEHCYIHLPFCRSKCAYCAFYSITDGDPALRSAYLDRLEQELSQLDFERPLRSLYFGGGTPTLLEMPELERLFRMIRKFCAFAPDAEISMEANPETLTLEKLELIHTLVNRLSLGVQHFDAKRRAQLGRRAGDEAIANALRWIQKTGFDNFNCDLICNLSGEPEAAWQSELERAAKTGATHLSCYELTLEENTRLALTPEVAQDDQSGETLWLATGNLLRKHGLERYEVSNYARPGRECRHNLAVWRGEAYVGLGAAASGFDGVDRYSNVESVTDWIKGIPAEWDRISSEERFLEIAAVHLRAVEGWTRSQWENLELQKSSPYSFDAMLKKLEPYRAQFPDHWQSFDNAEQIALSEKGLLYWNDLAEFLW